MLPRDPPSYSNGERADPARQPLVTEGAEPESREGSGARSLLAGSVLLAYAALLFALLAIFSPPVTAAIVALLCALGSVGCYLRYRRTRSSTRSLDPGQATSPANQQFRERPIFFVSRIAAIFCGVFAVTSSAGALFLGGSWTAPVTYGITALTALTVTIAHRKPRPNDPHDSH